jgi:hypothetical protein
MKMFIREQIIFEIKTLKSSLLALKGQLKEGRIFNVTCFYKQLFYPFEI